MRSRRLLALAAVLFLVRACFCFWGYDRRPLITSNDEAIVQDAAVALSRGEGLRAVSFGTNGWARDLNEEPSKGLVWIISRWSE